MKIVLANPPNIDAIDAVFHVKGRPAVYYCWGDIVYNPSGFYIPAELLAHEEIHSDRQRRLFKGPEDWWDRYLTDPQHRFDEELPAHVREYQFYCGTTKLKTRHDKYLDMAAKRLSGELYGNMVSFGEAKRLIRLGAKK